MAVKVWSFGVALIFAFILGTTVEYRGDPDSLPLSQTVAFIVLGAWSVAVWLVAVGYSEGKRKS